MEVLLKKFAQGRLDRTAEANLISEHHRHFQRRVRPLSMVLSREERSPDGIASLGNEAYVSFRSIPNYEGRPAFEHVVHADLPAKPFLYYWRASATIRFLREEGPRRVQERFKLLRNIRIHLKNSFIPVGEIRKEPLWGLPEWSGQARIANLNIDDLTPDLRNLRGKAQIAAILKEANQPLTRSEIAHVLCRTLEWNASGHRDTEHMESPAASPDTNVWKKQVVAQAERLFESLSEDERALLRARQYHLRTSRPRPFSAVARDLGPLTPESYRLKERRILETWRETFDDVEEMRIAVEVIIDLLARETAQEAAS